MSQRVYSNVISTGLKSKNSLAVDDSKDKNGEGLDKKKSLMSSKKMYLEDQEKNEEEIEVYVE